MRSNSSRERSAGRERCGSTFAFGATVFGFDFGVTTCFCVAAPATADDAANSDNKKRRRRIDAPAFEDLISLSLLSKASRLRARAILPDSQCVGARSESC